MKLGWMVHCSSQKRRQATAQSLWLPSSLCCVSSGSGWCQSSCHLFWPVIIISCLHVSFPLCHSHSPWSLVIEPIMHYPHTINHKRSHPLRTSRLCDSQSNASCKVSGSKKTGKKQTRWISVIVCGCFLNVCRLGRVAQRVGLNVNEYFDSFGLCYEGMCVCGVAPHTCLSQHDILFILFTQKNNSVSSTTDMLASLNRHEETGIKKKSFLSIPKFISSNIYVFLIHFWKVMPALNGPFSPGDRENAWVNFSSFLIPQGVLGSSRLKRETE